MASSVDAAISFADSFSHMRIINGMGISLCLSRLLIFASKFVQHPTRHTISSMHIGWVLVVFLWIIQFWWNYLLESGAKQYDVYTYILDLLYVFGLFFVCVTLTPDEVKEYGGYERYFLSRKAWFFSLFIFLNLIEFLSQIKIDLVARDYTEMKSDALLFSVETVGIIFAICIKQRGFQFFLIALLLFGILVDFVTA
ncbi:hypothetical protein DKP76_12260 [Falsochrobactrum shanghaiense]|uniref:Uncharacterized protein n=1 Tax=Falsochrobactrum shanghaiense TaxID=2201899 RepID=A0A316JEI2_9HYPH|nr:hypothetical protein [Falsochrobactrum shanghaiense]PWL17533.1 hypothetical protein DKP76_12260 [Falsochrobactrum shanghaiense]